MFKVFVFSCFLLLFFSGPVFCDDKLIRATSVALVSSNKQKALLLNQKSRLLVKFQIDSSKQQFLQTFLHVALKNGSNGIISLRRCSNRWDTRRASWRRRPAMIGPVIGYAQINSKQSEAIFDLSPIIKNRNIYSFSLYGNRKSKMQFKQSSVPYLERLQIAATPTAIPIISGINIIRGPYLQSGSSSSIVIKWRTDSVTNSVVYFGKESNLENFTSMDSELLADHTIRLTGLDSNSTYYYRVGNSSGSFQRADLNQFFNTSPATNNSKDTRVWVIGDSGSADNNATAVRDAYLNYTNARHTDFWLMLGDNAYNTGSDQEYQSAVFNTYPALLKNSVLWPTIGNHDASDATSINHAAPYFSIFNLPEQAEAGGVPSGTESYYSFDYGDKHFICLNSMGLEHRSSIGAMKTWLENDLAAAVTKRWIIAFWHHPPYSKGSHNSDTEIELKEMRENFLPVLEQGGVDLVLSGHSHSYERSFFIDNYYGFSNDFNNSHKKSNNDAGPYIKNYYTAHAGSIYIVAGSSSKLQAAPLNHPVMLTSQLTLGSVVLDFIGNNLEARFISSTGSINDAFTIQKAQ